MSAICRRRRRWPWPPASRRTRSRALPTFAFPGPVDQIATGRQHCCSDRSSRSCATMATFAVTAEGWHLPARHRCGARPIRETDFVAVAERFIGAPYLWGGKNQPRPRLLRASCRCRSHACGIGCVARQRHAGSRAGRGASRATQTAPARRSYLLEGSCRRSSATPATMIHANAFHMQVAIENIADRLSPASPPPAAIVTSIKRI